MNLTLTIQRIRAAREQWATDSAAVKQLTAEHATQQDRCAVVEQVPRLAHIQEPPVRSRAAPLDQQDTTP